MIEKEEKTGVKVRLTFSDERQTVRKQSADQWRQEEVGSVVTAVVAIRGDSEEGNFDSCFVSCHSFSR